jgi:hypothetical protein
MRDEKALVGGVWGYVNWNWLDRTVWLSASLQAAAMDGT